MAGSLCADFGGARASDPDPIAVDSEDPSGRGSPQPHPPGLLRVVSRKARVREGAHLQGRRVRAKMLLLMLPIGAIDNAYAPH